MRKRIEISYLTFLGLSLTVVVTACNDRASEISSFSFSNAISSSTKVFSSADFVDFLNASKEEDGTFAFEDNYVFHKALQQTTQFLVEGGQRVIIISDNSHEFSTFYPDRLVGLVSSNIYKSELNFLTYNYLSKGNHLIVTHLFTAYPVRAGPFS